LFSILIIAASLNWALPLATAGGDAGTMIRNGLRRKILKGLPLMRPETFK
jgi:hypothetical protein